MKKALLIPLFCLLASGCGNPSTLQPAPTPTPTPIANQPIPPTDGTVEINPQTAPMNSGNTAGAKLGFFKLITTHATTGQSTATFLEANMFSGEQARAEATKDWNCGKPNPSGPCDDTGKALLGNPFYIHTTNVTKQLVVTKDTDIKLISLDSSVGVGIKPGTLQDLEKVVTQDTANLTTDTSTANGQRTPFWIRLNGTNITHIEEQYIP